MWRVLSTTRQRKVATYSGVGRRRHCGVCSDPGRLSELSKRRPQLLTNDASALRVLKEPLTHHPSASILS